MKAFVSIVLVAFCLASVHSEAQLRKLTGGAFGGKKSKSSIGAVGVGDEGGAGGILSLIDSQGDLMQEYVVAKSNEAEAKSLVAEALGMKKEAAAYKATADKLSSGNVKNKTDINKHTKVSDKANQKIDDELDKNEELSGESKRLIGESMKKYGLSLAHSRILLKDTIPYWNETRRTLLNSGVIEKVQATRKLSDGIFVARNTPGHLRNLVTTFKKLRAVSKSQNIDYPKEATKDLDELEGEKIEDLEDLEEL